MKYFLKLLLITLLLGTTLLADEFKKPPYDKRLDLKVDGKLWYENADTNSDFAYNLGVLYQTRFKEYKTAELWYKQAINIDMKNIDAMYNLAMLYEDKQILSQAKYWYEKAIERESLSAMKNLSLLYYKQLHDTPKAVEYFIPLIDKRYSKEKVLKFFKVKYKADDKTIKQGYEAQLKSKIIPEKLKYKGEI
jgi:uncharacterized protein